MSEFDEFMKPEGGDEYRSHQERNRQEKQDDLDLIATYRDLKQSGYLLYQAVLDLQAQKVIDQCVRHILELLH